MSKLITHISRQAAFSFPGPPESVESQAFYHIATLLMQGSADKGYARDVIAVTGVQQQMGTSFTSPGLDKPAQAPSSPDINDRLVEIHITIAQNQSTESSSDGHTVFPVRASTTPVDAILEAAYVVLSETCCTVAKIPPKSARDTSLHGAAHCRHLQVS